MKPYEARQRQTKEYGVYYWDTFDDETFFVEEFKSLVGAEKYIRKKFRVRNNGADQVDIVKKDGGVIRSFKVG